MLNLPAGRGVITESSFRPHNAADIHDPQRYPVFSNVYFFAYPILVNASSISPRMAGSSIVDGTE